MMVIKWGVRISLYNNREEEKEYGSGIIVHFIIYHKERTVDSTQGNTGVQDTISKKINFLLQAH